MEKQGYSRFFREKYQLKFPVLQLGKAVRKQIRLSIDILILMVIIFMEERFDICHFKTEITTVADAIGFKYTDVAPYSYGIRMHMKYTGNLTGIQHPGQ